MQLLAEALATEKDDLVHSRRRTQLLTPDSVIVGLLGVIGLLFLSEYFQWFAVNGKKNYTLLIAATTAAATLALFAAWFIAFAVVGKRLQFSLRFLLLLTLVIAVLSSWFAVQVRQARRQRAAISSIAAAGAHTLYHWEIGVSRFQTDPPGPAWLRQHVGRDFFSHVYCVQPGEFGRLSESAAMLSDIEMAGLSEFTKLNLLAVEGAAITDKGLKNLAGLHELKHLGLSGTRITDVGLQFLQDLTELETLYLTDTQVTDAGINHLNGLRSLKTLSLTRTKVTAKGILGLSTLPALDSLALPLPLFWERSAIQDNFKNCTITYR